ncbi:hypothetical protein BDK92_1340 [Micromonospora pisi]|uniref:Uncharacterized protein n=1 Tax=Micromonospora pisi TaxID=589240 RepID=A0A495JEW6_9ACTN|nr:hypothetical protein BDK92_1340 [Micromonospora pisi]
MPPTGRRRPGAGHPPSRRRPQPPTEGWRAAPATTRRARLAALAVLGCLALSSGAGLAAGLVSCTPAAPTDPARALTAAEAHRLASMRIVNYRHGRAGVRATLGGPGTQIQLTGTVDWPRALAYLRVGGPGAGSQRGLLQAVPGLVVTRPDVASGAPGEPAGEPPASGADQAGERPEPPPEVPPTDGWRARRLVTSGPVPAAVDSFLALLFAVAADRPDPAEPLLAGDGARWLGRDHAGGVDVDVLLGPAVPVATGHHEPVPGATGHHEPGSGPGPSDTAEPAPAVPDGLAGGAVRYWLDDDGQLHRFEALLAGDVPVQVDVDRAALPELNGVAALGGPPVEPRAVTADEADLLARVRSANRAPGGAEIGLAVPTQPVSELPAANLRAAGWVDWSRGVAYLGVHELDRPGERTLLRADRTGVAVRDVPAAPAPSPSAGTPGTGPRTRPAGAVPPPLPPPRDREWSYLSWQRRADALGAPDLDLLLNEALAIGGAGLGSAARLRESANWLRQESLDGRPVAVFEVPKEAEVSVGRGQARMRYWVDGDGLLRRLELRTRIGAFAQLDLAPGRVPELPAVPVD